MRNNRILALPTAESAGIQDLGSAVIQAQVKSSQQTLARPSVSGLVAKDDNVIFYGVRRVRPEANQGAAIACE